MARKKFAGVLSLQIILVLVLLQASFTGCAGFGETFVNVFTAGEYNRTKAASEMSDFYNKIITTKKDDIRGEIITTEIQIVVKRYSRGGYFIPTSSLTFHKTKQGDDISYRFELFIDASPKVWNLFVKIDESFYTYSNPNSSQSKTVYFSVPIEMAEEIKNCKALSVQFLQEQEKIGEYGLAQLQSIIE